MLVEATRYLSSYISDGSQRGESKPLEVYSPRARAMVAMKFISERLPGNSQKRLLFRKAENGSFP